MVEEYMRQIKSLLKKYKDETITEEENLFLEYLMINQLERMVMEEELSDEELELLEDWKREREFLKDTDNIFAFDPEEIEEAAISSWHSFSEKMNIPSVKFPEVMPEPFIPGKETIRKLPLKRYVIITASIVASIALLISISLPILRDANMEKSKVAPAYTEMVLSKRITAEKNIRKITLADGTMIYLNRGTTMSLYKDKINAYQREVWLDEGEAFFEVAKDPKRPFIVHTADGLTTQVLGTSFNIKAYEKLGEQVISVKTGLVQVSHGKGQKILLHPDNKAQFNKKDGRLTAGLTNGKDAAAWRTGTIVLLDAGLDELALRFEQIYGVQLENRNNAINPQLLLYTSFDINTPLSTVASRIARIYEIKYKEEDRKIIFYR